MESKKTQFCVNVSNGSNIKQSSYIENFGVLCMLDIQNTKLKQNFLGISSYQKIRNEIQKTIAKPSWHRFTYTFTQWLEIVLEKLVLRDISVY